MNIALEGRNYRNKEYSQVLFSTGAVLFCTVQLTSNYSFRQFPASIKPKPMILDSHLSMSEHPVFIINDKVSSLVIICCALNPLNLLRSTPISFIRKPLPCLSTQHSMAALGSISITYVPADCGSIIPGKSKAPKAFQDVSIASKLRNAGLPSVSEHHPLDSPATYAATTFAPGSVRNEDVNISVCQRVRRTITQNLNAFTKPPFQLILGGECCMSPAILSAFWQHADSQTQPLRVGVIYIDADTDLASPTDPGSTGNLAGMNMTHLIRSPGALQSMEQFARPSGEPLCDPSNTVLFGINMSFSGNKQEHFTYLFDNNYKVVSSASVARGPEQRAEEALKYLEDRVDVIMVHLDVDAIDPLLFPLANLPNFTGVTFEQMMRALKIFLASERVGGLTIAEVNPDHDPGLGMVERLTGQVVEMLAARGGR